MKHRVKKAPIFRRRRSIAGTVAIKQWAVSLLTLAYSVSFVITPIFAARAYEGCPDSTDGIVGIIKGTNVTFINDSSECRHIGIAVYRLFSLASREGDFYYSKVTGLQAGETVTYSIPTPPCAYVVDAMVGEPIQTVKSKADYGSKLLVEQAATSLAYCPVSASGSSVAPSRGGAPLPSPKPSEIPLPHPKVLGAFITPTSSDALAVKTGSDETLIFALLASVFISAAAVMVRRKHPKNP